MPMRKVSQRRMNKTVMTLVGAAMLAMICCGCSSICSRSPFALKSDDGALIRSPDGAWFAQVVYGPDCIEVEDVVIGTCDGCVFSSMKDYCGYRDVKPIWYPTQWGYFLLLLGKCDTHMDDLRVVRFHDRTVDILYASPRSIAEDFVDHLYIDDSSIEVSPDGILEFVVSCDSQDGKSDRIYHISAPLVFTYRR